jgi:cobalt/nickel transport protein
MFNGKKIDLLKELKRKVVQGKSTWVCRYRIKRPGNYIFYVKPKPYWEPAEETFIVHFTKVVVNALGLEQGWDQEVGLPVEIVPLTRPYGLWAGNVFVGQVKRLGKPLPYATVEVEFYNPGRRVKAPAGPYITQVIKADEKGVFVFGIPKEGWWGFAALTEAEHKLKKDGKEYPVEWGGVLWIRARRMP